jgi:2-oxoglutarate ferredoxin oxidoreductase subunit delta
VVKTSLARRRYLNLALTEKKHRTADLIINREWCKGCGICIAFCPREALYMDDNDKAVNDVEKCVACGICETFCPDFAIALVKRRLDTNAGDETGFDARQ